MKVLLVRAPAPTSVVVIGDIDVRIKIEFAQYRKSRHILAIPQFAVPQVIDISGYHSYLAVDDIVKLPRPIEVVSATPGTELVLLHEILECSDGSLRQVVAFLTGFHDKGWNTKGRTASGKPVDWVRARLTNADVIETPVS